MRSEYCGLVDRKHLNQTITVYGWVHRRRDHGGVIFIDLRDREGLLQIVCDPDTPDTLKVAETLRNEFVVRVTGRVRERPAGTVNPNLVSGEVEVLAAEIEVLNPSLTPPFLMDDDTLSENVRLEYRFLDLRRLQMQKNLKLRYKTAMAVRVFLDQHGFIDIETPMLTRSTPEGARDYLVPSRVHAGKFFALPQSPQLFKQLLMISGFRPLLPDRQVFPRRGPARRPPAGIHPDRRRNLVHDAERDHGADGRADPHRVQGRARHRAAEAVSAHVVRRRDPAVRLGQAGLARIAQIDRAHRRDEDRRVQSVLGPREFERRPRRRPADSERRRAHARRNRRLHGVRRRLRRERPRLYQIQRDRQRPRRHAVADRQEPRRRCIEGHRRAHGRQGWRSRVLRRGHGQSCRRCAGRAARQDRSRERFCDGRMAAAVGGGLSDVRMGREGKRWNAMHHPFTAPADGHEDFLDSDPGRARAKAHDMVLNGWELGGGSVRIHRQDVQSKVFRALNISAEEAEAKFGFLLQALQFGAPPHGGIAFGLDRLVTMMAGAESIRDVIAFPKTQRAQCLLTQAPNTVDELQLRELHIRLRQEAPKP
jgi:aspartyl-tRNA synthetase